MKHDLPAFALLIDADNVRQDSIALILEEITRHARVTVRRIYGDFTSSSLAGWKNQLAEHAIHPIQQYRNTVGKNASDSALIIDAMDLLHSGRFEGFCIVSSDSDFTRLATRIREDGLIVFGFGEKKAPKAFVSACDRYIYIENLVAEKSPVPPQLGGGQPAAAPQPATTHADIAPKPPGDAAPLLMRAYTNVTDDLGWAMLGPMASYIHANHPDFDPRTYGCSKFSDLIQKAGQFELELRPHKNGQSHYCRPRTTAPRSKTASNPVAKTATKPAAKPHKKPNTDSPTPTLQQGIIAAVTAAGGEHGWAAVGIIGQKLKAAGHSIKGSGHSTLSKALQASDVLDMKENGAARYFRFKPTV